jgi:hypothetical protein
MTRINAGVATLVRLNTINRLMDHIGKVMYA